MFRYVGVGEVAIWLLDSELGNGKGAGTDDDDDNDNGAGVVTILLMLVVDDDLGSSIKLNIDVSAFDDI